MQTEVYSRRSQIPLDEHTWNALVGHDETHTVFQTYQWFDSWWSAFGAEYELFFIVTRDAREIVGFAPLMICRSGRRRVLSFATDPNSDYNDIIASRNKPEVVREILRTIADHSALWDRVSLRNIPQQSVTHAIIKDASRRHAFRRRERPKIASPMLQIKGREPEIRALINKYSIRRPYRVFHMNGRLELERITERSEAEAMLPLFFEQHIERCKITHYESPFVDHRMRRLYLNLLSTMLPHNWVFFSVLRFDDEPIAFHFGFDYRSRIIWYKPSFDIALGRYSPGSVLLRQLIDYALHHGRSELDLSIGDEPFKERFSNDMNYNVSIDLYRRPLDYWYDRAQRFLIDNCKVCLVKARMAFESIR